jgi:hypothetical protein
LRAAVLRQRLALYGATPVTRLSREHRKEGSIIAWTKRADAGVSFWDSQRQIAGERRIASNHAYVLCVRTAMKLERLP